MIPPCFPKQSKIPRTEIIPPRNHPPPEKSGRSNLIAHNYTPIDSADRGEVYL